ncbi:MAG TPA: hypothetical protein VL201_03450 [Patescibacteria group bacterium]|jgi:hypothetical protein|nr:hypothetical protein [Patescibacteria group bacterium]
MLKKMSSLMLLVAATAAYADVSLDIRLTLTKGELVREISKQITIAEDVSVELHRCESGQLIGLVTDVTETGAQLNLQVNECAGEFCTPYSNPTLNLVWNEKATVSLGKNHEDLVVENLTIEVIAQRVEAEQK